MVDQALFTSDSIEHGTPRDLFEALDREFHFHFDAAATLDNRKLQRFLTGPCTGNWKGEHCGCGLCGDWLDYTVFVNPPYGKKLSYAWVKKCWTAASQGATVVALLPARTDTSWFHNFVWRATEVRLIQGRLKFEGNDSSAPFPSMVVVWRPLWGANGTAPKTTFIPITRQGERVHD